MKQTSLAFAFAALLSGVTFGQNDYATTLDTGASAFTWSGTTSLGAIVGNPDHFNLVGSLTLTLPPGVTQPIGTLRFNGGNGHVTPDISGEIPNPVPFLPPLATLDIANLNLSVTSTMVPLSPGGAFTTDAIFTAISGVMTIVPLAGSTVVTDLSGSQSDPTQISGTLSYANGHMNLTAPINITFQFTDAGSGISGTVNLVGTIVSDYDCPAAQNYCSSSANSTGFASTMGHSGSTGVFANDLVLLADNLPSQPGIFYYGPNQIAQPFGNGTRCVGGAVVRLGAVVPDGLGVASFALDNTATPPGSEITPGSSWNFQFWYRDPAGGGAFFDLSDGLAITFCP